MLSTTKVQNNNRMSKYKSLSKHFFASLMIDIVNKMYLCMTNAIETRNLLTHKRVEIYE